MSMGTIGKILKATRTQMIENEADHAASEFMKRFGLRDGDYIRLRKNGGFWTTARILSVENVWFNQNNGYSAEVTITPLLVSGKIGKTRSCYLTVNANGTGLRAFHYYDEVQQVEPSRNAF